MRCNFPKNSLQIKVTPLYSIRVDGFSWHFPKSKPVEMAATMFTPFNELLQEQTQKIGTEKNYEIRVYTLFAHSHTQQGANAVTALDSLSCKLKQLVLS